MILARAGRYCLTAQLALALAMVATQARADVLEIGSEGARWVAGGPVGAVDNTAIQLPAELNAYGFDDPAAVATQQNLDASGWTDQTVFPDVVVADPRVHAAAVPPRYAAKVAELAQRFDLSPSLIEALVWQESRWRENAVSHAGARGLAQLMPGTARYLGVDPDDPMQNLEGGARYLREQLDRFDQDLEKALAAYNAGPGRVIKAGGVPNIRETRQYVAAIMGRLADHSRPAVSQ